MFYAKMFQVGYVTVLFCFVLFCALFKLYCERWRRQTGGLGVLRDINAITIGLHAINGKVGCVMRYHSVHAKICAELAIPYYTALQSCRIHTYIPMNIILFFFHLQFLDETPRFLF